jgi:Zn-dependent protease
VKYSWKLGQPFGIDVFLHWSFLIVPGWVALSTLAAGGGLAAAVNTILFVLAIFGCVLLHELGHALTARSYGIATRDITLLPIGGVARLERLPARPMQELMIAAAGPLVNVAIAAALVALNAVAGRTDAWLTLLPGEGSFVANLAGANLALAVFNLLPAFPMDGGRILRALLAMWRPYAQATRIAAGVGQGLAICLALVGLLGNWTLLLVALFVFVAARAEADAVTAQSLTAQQANAAPCTTPAVSNALVLLPAHARADEVTQAMFSQQHYFPVVQGGEVVGVLSKATLLRALANDQGDWLVAELMTDTSGRTLNYAYAYADAEFRPH